MSSTKPRTHADQHTKSFLAQLGIVTSNIESDYQFQNKKEDLWEVSLGAKIHNQLFTLSDPKPAEQFTHELFADFIKIVIQDGFKLKMDDATLNNISNGKTVLDASRSFSPDTFLDIMSREEWSAKQVAILDMLNQAVKLAEFYQIDKSNAEQLSSLLALKKIADNLPISSKFLSQRIPGEEKRIAGDELEEGYYESKITNRLTLREHASEDNISEMCKRFCLSVLKDFKHADDSRQHLFYVAKYVNEILGSQLPIKPTDLLQQIKQAIVIAYRHPDGAYKQYHDDLMARMTEGIKIERIPEALNPMEKYKFSLIENMHTRQKEAAKDEKKDTSSDQLNKNCLAIAAALNAEVYNLKLHYIKPGWQAHDTKCKKLRDEINTLLHSTSRREPPTEKLKLVFQLLIAEAARLMNIKDSEKYASGNSSIAGSEDKITTRIQELNKKDTVYSRGIIETLKDAIQLAKQFKLDQSNAFKIQIENMGVLSGLSSTKPHSQLKKYPLAATVQESKSAWVVSLNKKLKDDTSCKRLCDTFLNNRYLVDISGERMLFNDIKMASESNVNPTFLAQLILENLLLRERTVIASTGMDDTVNAFKKLTDVLVNFDKEIKAEPAKTSRKL